MEKWLAWFLDRLELGILWLKWVIRVLEWGKTIFSNFPKPPAFSDAGSWSGSVLQHKKPNEGKTDKP